MHADCEATGAEFGPEDPSPSATHEEVSTSEKNSTHKGAPVPPLTPQTTSGRAHVDASMRRPASSSVVSHETRRDVGQHSQRTHFYDLPASAGHLSRMHVARASCSTRLRVRPLLQRAACGLWAGLRVRPLLRGAGEPGEPPPRGSIERPRDSETAWLPSTSRAATPARRSLVGSRNSPSLAARFGKGGCPGDARPCSVGRASRVRDHATPESPRKIRCLTGPGAGLCSRHLTRGGAVW